MSTDMFQPHTTSELTDRIGDGAPSAAAAGEPAKDADDRLIVPVTAWSSPEDCEALAKGLTHKASPAEWAFARLTRMIEDFERKLDADHEVGCTFVGAPGDVSMRIDDLGYWPPDLLLFYGKNSYGKPVRIVQHFAQLNLMLSAEPKELPLEPPRRIGFALRERLEQAASKGSPAPPAPDAAPGPQAPADNPPRKA